MKVNNKLVQELAKLSKLNFNKKSEEKMKNDLEKIIHFVNKLSELETKNIQPLVYISSEKNVLRKDINNNKTSREEALKNAPKKNSDYFTVPTVIKK